MLDVVGASRAVQSTSINAYLLSQNILPSMASLKASWNVAVKGTYALLEPLVHQDYYTSDEVDVFLINLENNIKLYIETIYNGHTHTSPFLGLQTGSPSSPIMYANPIMPYIRMETFIPKVSRPIEATAVVSAALADLADIEVGTVVTETMEVYALSPVIGLI